MTDWLAEQKARLEVTPEDVCAATAMLEDKEGYPLQLDQCTPNQLYELVRKVLLAAGMDAERPRDEEPTPAPEVPAGEGKP